MKDGGEEFMREAIRLSIENVNSAKGGPFGAVIVQGEKIIARGVNEVTTSNDATAHAEVAAIRAAGKRLGDFRLSGCEIYCSCEPCPMCLGAIYWSRIDAVYFANTKEDAAQIGFDDLFIYGELVRPIAERNLSTQPMMMLRQEALEAFAMWAASAEKTEY